MQRDSWLILQFALGGPNGRQTNVGTVEGSRSEATPIKVRWRRRRNGIYGCVVEVGCRVEVGWGVDVGWRVEVGCGVEVGCRVEVACGVEVPTDVEVRAGVEVAAALAVAAGVGVSVASAVGVGVTLGVGVGVKVGAPPPTTVAVSQSSTSLPLASIPTAHTLLSNAPTAPIVAEKVTVIDAPARQAAGHCPCDVA